MTVTFASPNVSPERERDAAKADYREMRQAWDDATIERDAALARLSDGVSPHDYRDLKAERDEWKAKCDQWRSGFKEMENMKDAAIIQASAERDAALARAEAAENELADRIKSAQHYGHEAALAHEQLTDLRARIEALADVEEKDGYTGRAFDLRALLQPPKAETALDVLSELEEQVPDADVPHYLVIHTMAKLRKLLEEKK